jgi:mono/diheme cytochrome c family protein
MRKLTFLLLGVLVLSLLACGGESAPEAGAGDAAAGETLFAQQLIETQPGCITCHSLEPGVTSVGPSVATIGAEAGSRVSGTSAEEYLRKSILEPDATVAEGFATGIMPKGFATALTEQQVNDLVAYMLTLR